MSTDPFSKSVIAEPIRDAVVWLKFSSKLKQSIFLDALNALLDDVSVSAYTGSDVAIKAFDRLSMALEDDEALKIIENTEMIASTPDISESDDIVIDLPDVDEEDIDIDELVEDTPPLPSEEESLIEKETDEV